MRISYGGNSTDFLHLNFLNLFKFLLKEVTLVQNSTLLGHCVVWMFPVLNLRHEESLLTHSKMYNMLPISVNYVMGLGELNTSDMASMGQFIFPCTEHWSNSEFDNNHKLIRLFLLLRLLIFYENALKITYKNHNWRNHDVRDICNISFFKHSSVKGKHWSSIEPIRSTLEIKRQLK